MFASFDMSAAAMAPAPGATESAQPRPQVTFATESVPITPDLLLQVAPAHATVASSLDLSRELSDDQFIIPHFLLREPPPSLVSRKKPVLRGRGGADEDVAHGLMFLYDAECRDYLEDGVQWRQSKMVVKFVVESVGTYRLRNRKGQPGQPVMRRQTWQGLPPCENWRRVEYRLILREQLFNAKADDGTEHEFKSAVVQPHPRVVHYFRKRVECPAPCEIFRSLLTVQDYSPRRGYYTDSTHVIAVCAALRSCAEVSCMFDGERVRATQVADGAFSFNTPLRMGPRIAFWQLVGDGGLSTRPQAFSLVPPASMAFVSFAGARLSACPMSMLALREFRHGVRELDVSSNVLTDPNVSFLEGYSDLTDLTITNNELTSGSQFPLLPQLTTLIIDGNHIEDLPKWVSVVSQRFPALKTLSMVGNPVQSMLGYREYVCTHLTQLVQLDNVPVTDADRVSRCPLNDSSMQCASV
eukprot:m51a1_g6724 hypothetical protein (469) ;mRNA; f:174647-176212